MSTNGLAPTGADSRPRGRALVTGASGIVGRNLVALLLDRGWEVRTFGRRALTGPEATRVDHFIGDVRDPRRVGAAVRDVEVVFHLAARVTLLSEDPDAWSINVDGPRIVARAARRAGVGRLVHCSSVHAFDATRGEGELDESCPRSGVGRPLYDRTKAAGEEAIRREVAAGLDATIINPTGIIGPVDPGLTRINRLMRTAARGRLVVATGGGFDFVDVRDVVLAAVAALDRGRTGESYLVPGHRISVMHLARMAAGLNGRLGPRVAVPRSVARRVAPAGERMGRWFHTDSFTPASINALIDAPFVDGTKAGIELGHRPRPVEDTVRDLIWWFHDAGLLDGTRSSRTPTRVRARRDPRRIATPPVADERAPTHR